MMLLEELGVDENTIVMFTSDNGSHLEGGHAPRFWDSNGPLRGHKRDLYEGGIRAPFVVKWPKVIKAGSVSDHPSAFWDIMPTMADILNFDTPKQSDGISFLPTLKGDSSQEEHPYMYWEFSQGKQQFVKGRAVRIGNWKAVVNYPRSKAEQSQAGEIELYDLGRDLEEQNNVADQHPEVVKKARLIMDKMKPYSFE